jgi:glycosyltransferase involved in cell wall biosynthesis
VRIVIDARGLASTTGRYVERLLHHLQVLDHDNGYLVLLSAEDDERWHPRASNFTKRVVAFRPYRVAEQVQYARLLHGLRPDLVHFTMPAHPLAYRGRHVVTVHDLTLVDGANRLEGGSVADVAIQTMKRAVFAAVTWSTARFATDVITPTRYIGEQLVLRFGADRSRVHVTHEGADPLTETPRTADYGQRPEFLLYVGNAYPYKNLWRLIQAYHRLERPDLSLLLVGAKDAHYERLERRTNDARIDGVIFTGFVADAELAWLYQHARLLVFPSLSEGFGLPPLEAMLYGSPVLSSNSSCLPEVYGNSVEYFDPLDTGDLAASIDRLLDDPERRRELKDAGRERVEGYSWRRMAEQTLSIYERAASTARPTPDPSDRHGTRPADPAPGG